MKNAVKLRVGNHNYLIGYFNAFMNSGPPEFGRSVNPIPTMGVGGLIMPITLLTANPPDPKCHLQLCL